MEEQNKQIQKRKFTRVYIITSVISLLVGLAIFSLIVFAFKKSVVDGFAYTGLVLVGGGAFLWIAHEGFFDVFGYGIKQMGSMFFSKKANENNDFATYKEQKNTIRAESSKYYAFILLVGFIFLLGVLLTKIIF